MPLSESTEFYFGSKHQGKIWCYPELIRRMYWCHALWGEARGGIDSTILVVCTWSSHNQPLLSFLIKYYQISWWGWICSGLRRTVYEAKFKAHTQQQGSVLSNKFSHTESLFLKGSAFGVHTLRRFLFFFPRRLRYLSKDWLALSQ